MVVMVEKEEVTGALNRGSTASERLGSERGGGGGGGSVGAASPRFDGNKLYADYLKREGRRPGTAGTTASARERREVDDQFRDF